MTRPLPEPVRTDEMYLAAILAKLNLIQEEIHGLHNAKVRVQSVPAEDGMPESSLVELREAILSVPGIGEARADKVLENLRGQEAPRKPRHRGEIQEDA